MTKPNNFIQTSDYLSLAQTSKYNFIVNVPSGTAPSGTKTLNYDFPTSVQQGSIDKISIIWNGVSYLSNALSFEPGVLSDNRIAMDIFVYRLNQSTMRVSVLLTQLSTATPVPYSAFSFSVKVAGFTPPNIF